MILVTGGSGRIGATLVELLCAAGQRVRVLTRSAHKAQRLAVAGAEIAIGDMSSPASLDPAMSGADRVFLLSKEEPEQVKLQSNVIQAAARAGVGRVVKLSAIGADRASPLREARWHAQTEQEIAAAGMTFTHLRPNYFMQNLRLYTQTIHEGHLAVPLGDARVSMIDCRDIAAAAAVVLTEPGSGSGSGHHNRTYTLTGPQALSFAEVADRLSAALGRTVRYTNITMSAARAAWQAQGLPAWRIESFAEIHREFSSGFGAAVTTSVADILGRPPRTFDLFARDFTGLTR